MAQPSVELDAGIGARAVSKGEPPSASASALSALLIVGGPALVALLVSGTESVRHWAAGACGALVMLTGFGLARGFRWSKPFAVVGLGLGLWVAAPALIRSPDFALLFSVAAVVISMALWAVPLHGSRAPWLAPLFTAPAIKSGTGCAAAAWLALAISEALYTPPALLAFCVSLALTTLFIGGWIVTRLQTGVRVAVVPLIILSVGVCFALALRERPVWALSAWVLGLAVAAPFVHSTEGTGSFWAVILERPARLVVVSFAGISVFGTLVLALPASATSGHSIGLLDAAFTAISATCVTGLIVLDTPNAFSTLGQGALLLLIQVGGLGIMTFYAVALRVFGRRMSLRHELAVTEASLLHGQASLYRMLGAVLTLTLSAELAGAAILCGCFRWHGDGWLVALWRGIFTAVSAFCNAGFALQTDNLIPYQSQPLVLATVALLIIVGGLAPLVVLSTPALLRGQVVPLQVRLAWVMTLGLLGVGFIAYLAFEWSHSLAGLMWWHKLSNAGFQSVTLRTAGFNSVDLTATRPATQVLMIALMFIGGTPGGTAGGIKNTTAALLLLAVLAALRGRPDVTVFGRRVVHASVYRAAAVATVGVMSVVSVLLALMLTQVMPPEVATFEAVSALATVGLSTGGTALADGVGKVILMAAMFAGRVGPLTLFLLLAEQRERTPWQFPDAEIDVG